MSKYKDRVERRFNSAERSSGHGVGWRVISANRHHGKQCAEEINRLYTRLIQQEDIIEQLLDHLNLKAVKPEKSQYSMVLADKS